MHHSTDRIAHTTAFVTPVVENWLEREIAQWVHPMKDRSDHPSHHERTQHLAPIAKRDKCQLLLRTRTGSGHRNELRKSSYMSTKMILKCSEDLEDGWTMTVLIYVLTLLLAVYTLIV